MLREWAVKVRCAGFPGIIPRSIKDVSALLCVPAFHSMPSLNTLGVTQSWIHEIAWWILNVSEKKHHSWLFGVGKGRSQTPQPAYSEWFTLLKEELNGCPEWRTSVNEALWPVQYSAVFPFHCLITTWSYPALWIPCHVKTGCILIFSPNESRKFGHKWKKNESIAIFLLNKISPITPKTSWADLSVYLIRPFTQIVCDPELKISSFD